MDTWVLLRFAKFVGVAVLSCGVLGSVLLPRAKDRQICAHVLATLGIIAVWLAGYGLLKAKGLSFREPWISQSLLAGLVAMFGAAWAANVGVVPRWARAVAVGALIAAFGLMSTRGASPSFVVVATGVAAVGMALVPTSPVDAQAADPDATLRWFSWLARAEGLSLIALLGVYMPLKYGAGIVLDGGQGWFGWMHGVLQLLFIVALLVTAWTQKWSMLRSVAGFVSSLVPLGTFIFEARLRSRS